MISMYKFNHRTSFFSEGALEKVSPNPKTIHVGSIYNSYLKILVTRFNRFTNSVNIIFQ